MHHPSFIHSLTQKNTNTAQILKGSCVEDGTFCSWWPPTIVICLKTGATQQTSYSGLCKVRGTLWVDLTHQSLRRRTPTGGQWRSPALKPCSKGAAYRTRPKVYLSAMESPSIRGSQSSWLVCFCATHGRLRTKDTGGKDITLGHGRLLWCSVGLRSSYHVRRTPSLVKLSPRGHPKAKPALLYCQKQLMNVFIMSTHHHSSVQARGMCSAPGAPRGVPFHWPCQPFHVNYSYDDEHHLLLGSGMDYTKGTNRFVLI